MTQTKICGIRKTAEIDMLATAGASFMGMVFFAASPRHLDYEQAAALASYADSLQDAPQRVALCVDADDQTLQSIISTARPHMLQLHGSETPQRCRQIRQHFGLPLMKALRIASPEMENATPFKTAAISDARAWDDAADWMLFDAASQNASLPGGTGHRFDWKLARQYDGPLPWMLAGGLDAACVAEAIRISGATAVDVSSGVEDAATGQKDAAAIQSFVNQANLG